MRRTGVVAGAVLLALTGYAVGDAVDVVPGFLTSDLSVAGPRPAQPDANGSPPAGLDTPGAPASSGPAAPPVLLPPPDGAPAPTAPALARVLTPLVTAPALGRTVGIDVRDAATGTVLYASGAARPATPASTTKIVTAAAVAVGDDLEATWRTRTVAGRTPDEVVLVAGGDNLLAPGAGDPGAVAGRAGLADLAARTAPRLASAGTGRPVRVVLDDSFAKGPPLAPAWGTDDVTLGLTGPVAMLGLASDRAVPGRAATPDPSMTAAVAFRAALAAEGVSVAPAVARGRARAGAAGFASVESAPVADVLALALAESDNDLTESVARWACVRRGQPATFSACAAWVQRTVADLGVSMKGVRLADTSGLSRGTTIPAATLTQLLTLAAHGDRPDLARVVARLPVAGLTGTLADRFTGAPERAGAGLVRAKTGTLTGVSSLAGTVVDADGRLLTFTVIADRVPPGGTVGARVALDRLATTLARCGCR